MPEPGPASRPTLPRRFDEYPCAALIPEIEAGNLRVLFVVGGNPVCALPDEARLRAAFATLDALVVIDVVRTDTTGLATHLLPAAGQLERADLPYLLDNYQLAVATQYTPAVLPVGADRKTVWRMFAELATRLDLDVLPRGVSLDGATDESLLAQVASRSRGGTDAVFAARSERCTAMPCSVGSTTACCPTDAGGSLPRRSSPNSPTRRTSNRRTNRAWSPSVSCAR